METNRIKLTLVYRWKTREIWLSESARDQLIHSINRGARKVSIAGKGFATTVKLDGLLYIKE